MPGEMMRPEPLLRSMGERLLEFTSSGSGANIA
jgi:hypothetical protein